uniref:Uncharacterized protein AlNc14C1G112 n=1 Tax=Albugo laibachii Nc14 TaxID=890382 RepID=F0VYW1_9STRA|nr:conserved hypothetical protein [Albugo laibachii Nc14]|eukprot:CCA13976.1 conserved hypothetical protein [Albugo laibachii Nc14]
MAPPLHRIHPKQEDTEIEEIDTDTLRKNQSSQYVNSHPYRPHKRRRTLSERLEELCLDSNDDASMESNSSRNGQLDAQDYDRYCDTQLSFFHGNKRPHNSRFLMSKQSEAARNQTNHANNLILEGLVSQYLASEISSPSTDLVLYHPKPQHSRFYPSNLRSKDNQDTRKGDDSDVIDPDADEDIDMESTIPKVPRLANSVTHSEWFAEAQEERNTINVDGGHPLQIRASLRMSAVLLVQALSPLPLLIYLPRLLYGTSLEQNVALTLPCAVLSVLILMIFCTWRLSHSAAMFTKSNNTTDFFQSFIRHGVLGLVIGVIGWFVIVVLFGAPLYQLLIRSLLLSLLIASFTTFPLSAHFGPSTSVWIQVVLNLSWKDKMCNITSWNTASKRQKNQVFLQAHSTVSCLGAVLGTYFGAFPIPLDWDRPWQQWPLPCVYGCLVGNSIGMLGLWVYIQTHKEQFQDVLRNGQAARIE